MKGWGPKSSVCPSKPMETKLFGGMSRDLAGISRVCPKSLRKKVCVQFSSPRKGLVYLRLGLFYLRLVFVAYGKLAWSFCVYG